MSWLSDFVRPKIQNLVGSREVPENLWDKCPQCSQMIFHRDMEKTFYVCTHCGHHLRLPAKKRLELLFDDGKYQRIELPKSVVDPLKFRDTKRYTDRLKDTQAKTGEQDALLVAHGRIGGVPAVAAVFDFDFMGGSMGTAVGDGLLAAAELAVLQDAALIVVPASGGARMQEGALSLMQLARTTVAVDKVKEKGLPYIVLLSRPDHRRRDRLLRHAGRHPHRRAGRGDRLRRSARNREHDPREAARGFPARRISARARHGRHGGAAHAVEGDAGAHPRHPASSRTGGRRAADGVVGRGRRGRPDDSDDAVGTGVRGDSRAPQQASPQADRPGAGSDPTPARRSRRSAQAPAAGGPYRRHQRQGFDARLSARHGRGGGH